MPRHRTKLKKPGDQIGIKLKENEPDHIVEWFNKQSVISESIRYFIEKDIAENGIRDISEELNKTFSYYKNVPVHYLKDIKDERANVNHSKEHSLQEQQSPAAIDKSEEISNENEQLKNDEVAGGIKSNDLKKELPVNPLTKDIEKEKKVETIEKIDSKETAKDDMDNKKIISNENHDDNKPKEEDIIPFSTNFLI